MVVDLSLTERIAREKIGNIAPSTAVRTYTFHAVDDLPEEVINPEDLFEAMVLSKDSHSEDAPMDEQRKF